MTLEEMQQKFPIGCTVKLVKLILVDNKLSNCHCEGDLAIVKRHAKSLGQTLLTIEWIKRHNCDDLSFENDYYPERFELVCYDSQAEIQQFENKLCPRCKNGQLIEKQTEFYGTIKKCNSCGYC